MAQLRYKNAYDRHVRVRNENLTVKDLVLVQTFGQPVGLSPKLLSPIFWPYALLARKSDTLKVRTSNREMRFNSDRLLKCSLPSDVAADMSYVKGVEEILDHLGSELELERREVKSDARI